MILIMHRLSSRVIANLDSEVLPTLKKKLARFEDDWDIRIVKHDNHRSPCSLMLMLHDSDVLLTAHGFQVYLNVTFCAILMLSNLQSMLLLFLPRPSLLFEVYPYKYFKRAYSPLAQEYGVMHANVMSPPVSAWNSILLHGCFLFLKCKCRATHIVM